MVQQVSYPEPMPEPPCQDGPEQDDIVTDDDIDAALAAALRQNAQLRQTVADLRARLARWPNPPSPSDIEF